MDSIETLLTPDALGVPNLTLLGPQIGAPFQARRMAKPRLLWLNKRWFFEHGIDAGRPDVEAMLGDWLLNNYAAIVPGTWDPPSAYSDGAIALQADRYGAPGGSTSGGSGRCGFAGAFNAKGIGQTPLVSLDVDWYHSHGCMWMEEALREAIMGEIADLELPHGAVPVVAIIDPCMRIHEPGGKIGARRAIVVRPNWIRLAHLERSIRFGVGGTSQSEQYLDAVRTADVARALEADHHGVLRLGLECRSFQESFTRLAEQVGSGWSLRLFHGGFFTSNLSLDGQLVDFGNFQSVPDWRHHVCGANAAAFGAEIGGFKAALYSLSFYARRYSENKASFHAERVWEEMCDSAQAIFLQQTCRGLGLANLAPTLSNEVNGQLSAIFHAMQAETASGQYRPGRWHSLWSGFDGQPTLANAIPEQRHAATLFRMLKSVLSPAELQHVRSLSQPWRRPRPLLDRAVLVRYLSALVQSKDVDSSAFPARVAAVINAIVARSRRSWRELPSQLAIREVEGDASTSLIRACSQPGAPSEQYVIASVYGERILLGGRSMGIGELPARGVTVTGRRACLTLDPHRASWEEGRPDARFNDWPGWSTLHFGAA